MRFPKIVIVIRDGGKEMKVNRHYHESRIRVLKEQKRRIDEEIKKHSIRLASRGNSTYLVQVKKAKTMDKGIDG